MRTDTEGSPSVAEKNPLPYPIFEAVAISDFRQAKKQRER